MDAHRSTYVLQVACKLTLIPLASGGQALRPIGQRLRQRDDLAGGDAVEITSNRDY